MVDPGFPRWGTNPKGRSVVACSVMGRSFMNACTYVYKFVGRKIWAAMLVNLNNLLFIPAGDEASKQGIHPGFEPQGSHHQKYKNGVSVAPQNGWLASSNLFFFQKKRGRMPTYYSGRFVSRGHAAMSTNVCNLNFT